MVLALTCLEDERIYVCVFVWPMYINKRLISNNISGETRNSWCTWHITRVYIILHYGIVVGMFCDDYVTIKVSKFGYYHIVCRPRTNRVYFGFGCFLYFICLNSTFEYIWNTVELCNDAIVCIYLGNYWNGLYVFYWQIFGIMFIQVCELVWQNKKKTSS